MLIRVNYANELSKHLNWHISSLIFMKMQTYLKEQGLKQTCIIKPRVSYKHDQVIFLDYFSLDLDIYS